MTFSRCRIARKERAVPRNPGPGIRACKTAWVTRGAHVAQESRFDPHQPLGATYGGAVDSEPISPELALVDPVLAEQARSLLPEPRERTRRRRARVATQPHGPDEVLQKAASSPAPRPRRRRWRRMVVLAVLVFMAGAAFAGLRKTKPDAPPPVTLGVAAAGAPATRASEPGLSRRKRASVRPNVSRPLSAKNQQRRRTARPASTSPWNGLGGTTAVDNRGVRLAWQRPPHFKRVVVFRIDGRRERRAIVYRGRATSYRDLSARRCTTYNYVIVNYDEAGHPSTGVPTSVLTGRCK